MTTINFVGKNTLIWHTVLTSFISTYLNFFQLLSGFMFPNSFLIRFLIVENKVAYLWASEYKCFFFLWCNYAQQFKRKDKVNARYVSPYAQEEL